MIDPGPWWVNRIIVDRTFGFHLRNGEAVGCAVMSASMMRLDERMFFTWSQWSEEKVFVSTIGDIECALDIADFRLWCSRFAWELDLIEAWALSDAYRPQAVPEVE